MAIYLGLVQPYSDPFMNKVEIFNELCILVVSYHLFMFTKFAPKPEIQYNAGWTIISITLLNIGTNMAIIIFKFVKSIKVKVKELLQKLKFRQGKVRKYVQKQNRKNNQMDIIEERKEQTINKKAKKIIKEDLTLNEISDLNFEKNEDASELSNNFA